jgi:hypothetical protein
MPVQTSKYSVLPRNLHEAVLTRILLLPVIFCCTETDTVGNARLNDWGDIQAGEIVLDSRIRKIPNFRIEVLLIQIKKKRRK